MARKRKKYVLDVAPDVQARIEEIAALLPEHFAHVDASRVVCFRSQGSTANIYARIWGLERIWQMALGVDAHYAIEVVEHFDRSPDAEQDRTLIHELMHIPKTFSGALVPHRCFGKKIDCDSVEVLYRDLLDRRAAAAKARLEEALAVPRSDGVSALDGAPEAPGAGPAVTADEAERDEQAVARAEPARPAPAAVALSDLLAANEEPGGGAAARDRPERPLDEW